MESITLIWDACTATNVAGYLIHHGPVGSGITNCVALNASTTTATVSNLPAGITCFFFVTAFDAQFLESFPSNVIFDTPPPSSGTNTTGASNSPPCLAPIAAQTVTAGQLLAFSATATDADVPAQMLTFHLAPGTPAGAGIDPVSGWFTWTPSLAEGGTTNLVTICVTDNGSPVLRAIHTVAITVKQLVSVSGSLVLEGYVGTNQSGTGQRTVRFVTTDIDNNVTGTWDVALIFAADSNGNGTAGYTLPNVLDGAANLSAKTAWTLRKRLDLTFANGEAVADFTGAAMLPAGDLDGANKVGPEDYHLLAAAWYQVNDAADIDGSGLVDFTDYFLLANRWGQSGDPE